VVSTSNKRSVYKKRNSCKASPLSKKLNNMIGSPKKHPKPPPEPTDGLPSTARMILESATPSSRRQVPKESSISNKAKDYFAQEEAKPSIPSHNQREDL